MCCQLVLLGLAQCKPELTNWACFGQAQAVLDGATGRVYPAPERQFAILATKKDRDRMSEKPLHFFRGRKKELKATEGGSERADIKELCSFKQVPL